MAYYLPPKYPQNKLFNVSDFDNNNYEYSIYDERYLKLFGLNNILSINNFYGPTTFLNNINSFMYLTVFKNLSVAYNIVCSKLIAENIQCTNIQAETINNNKIMNTGVYIYINNIQYPLIKSYNDILNCYEQFDFTGIKSVLLYPNYSIKFYSGNNIQLYSLSNDTDDIIKHNIVFKYPLQCKKVYLYFNNKKL
jgi:hypothetical protein